MGKRSRSGVTARFNYFLVLWEGKPKKHILPTSWKTAMLSEVSQAARAEEIIEKLFSQLKRKLVKTKSKIAGISNETNSTIIMIKFINSINIKKLKYYCLNNSSFLFFYVISYIRIFLTSLEDKIFW